MAYNEESSASGHDEPWIQWFCGLKGHEMFCEVERSYIEDGFNLYGLRASVSNFSDCLDLILDRIGPDDSDESKLTQSACTLYGLIHARYIITAHGLDAMYNKYAAKEFGTCPLTQCTGQPVLPVGLRDEIGQDSVKIFCPKCQCVYHPPYGGRRGGSGTVDGASFGTTFPHLFLMTFSNLVPDGLAADATYVPRVFGFRVHHSARLRPSERVNLDSNSRGTSNNNTGGNAARGSVSLQINDSVADLASAAGATAQSSVLVGERASMASCDGPSAPQNDDAGGGMDRTSTIPASASLATQQADGNVEVASRPAAIGNSGMDRNTTINRKLVDETRSDIAHGNGNGEDTKPEAQSMTPQGKRKTKVALSMENNANILSENPNSKRPKRTENAG
uniref:Casein kinase II subunit beta n=1 Tax=Proboscia inermis TaxID=420281 RepID=A0A7S0GAP8_9STRA|mmetsp:Transcript_2667/g.2698  ORF Transcript_2667/g.2698 Transcript_2667/m.2698 type:complete len:392 (+) Transcript_2667:427-1602(+)